MSFRGGISSGVKGGGEELILESMKGNCKMWQGTENSDNELSVTQDSLFPSMKTTCFCFMFCPVFCNVILK